MRATAWLAALAAALFLAFSIPPAAAQSDNAVEDEALEAAHKAYLKDPAMQLERPEAEPIEREPYTPRERGWLYDLGRFLADLLSALGPLFRIIFYAILGAAVLGILYFLLSQLTGVRLFGRRDATEDETVGDDVLDTGRPNAAVARSLLKEADALAREGRFAEAVHLLLFRSIEEIQTRRAGGLSRALTAREIGGLKVLPANTRAALQPIISLVERSFFGGREVDEAGWNEARASYETFAFGDGW